MDRTKILEHIKDVSAKAAKDAMQTDDLREKQAIHEAADKDLQDAPHRQKGAKKVIGEFFKDLAKGGDGSAYLSEVQTKDVNELGSNAAGGYLVPLEFSGTLIERLYKMPVIRQFATVLPMTSDKMQVPVEGNAPTTNWTAELATITQSDPTFSQLTLSVNNLIGISRMSRQILIDSAIQYSLVDYIVNRFVAQIGRAEDAAFMAGSGSGQPLGIRQYTYANTRAQSGAHLTADDLISTYYLLAIQYRSDAVWLMNDKVAGYVRQLKDSSGRYLWSDAFETGSLLQAGQFPSLLGRPVLIENDIPTNLGGGTNASEVYFGNLGYYLIGQREGIFSEVSTQEGTSFAQHRAAVKVGERLDGQLSLTESFAQMTAVIQ